MANKNNSNKHIFDIVSKIIKPILKNKEEYFIALVENWYIIMPKSWHKGVYPVKFRWINNNKAILIVKVQSNAQSINLQFSTPQAIDNINAYFGHNIVTKISFNIN